MLEDPFTFTNIYKLKNHFNIQDHEDGIDIKSLIS